MIICILIINILIIYLTLSFFEWYIHKNLMHKNDINIFINLIDKIYFCLFNEDLRKNHINHHKFNNIDGTIENDDGTTFHNLYKFILPICLMIPYYIISKLIFNFNNITYIKIFIFFLESNLCFLQNSVLSTQFL